jgi:SAM-dependent methyltransferase
VGLQRFFDAARNLEGWNLEFAPEPLEPAPPWSYEALARDELARAHSALELGTGGGEVFAGLLAAASCRAVATESWHRNAPLAAARLGTRARVVRASSLRLPFRSGCFDLVLARHEEIAPDEVARVLTQGGRFLTQQVIPDVWPELASVFPDMTRFPDHFAAYSDGLRAEGLVVELARDCRHRVRYRELGHFIYHLTAAAPWMLPGFGLETHAEAIAQLERWAARDHGIIVTEGFTLIRARVPGDPRSGPGDDHEAREESR